MAHCLGGQGRKGRKQYQGEGELAAEEKQASRDRCEVLNMLNIIYSNVLTSLYI